MLSRLDLRGRSTAPTDLAPLLARPVADDGPVAAVREIIAEVRERGDAALYDLTERFDGVRPDDLRVSPEECRDALDATPADFRAALELAADQIESYHRTQLAPDAAHQGPSGPLSGEYSNRGVHIREMTIPVDRAGLYVPGGRAAYPSTVLMTAIPARVAGVAEVVLCVPNPPPATLAAAALAGVDEVYRVGGAQAIAAMAYGTATIRPVDVIVGPGNVYVALAKREVSGTVGIEALAGPSELVVVADDTAAVDHVAIDLVAQAEHGPGGAALLVTWEEGVADAVTARVAELVAESPRREEVESTMRTGGTAVLVDGPEAAMDVANFVAPEHLEIQTADPEALVPLVRHAGAVFCGAFAPAAVGDYVAGVNHVLPTTRTARFSSALRVSDFQKHTHVVSLDEAALAALAPHIQAFAAVEGLDAHGRSVEMRKPAP